MSDDEPGVIEEKEGDVDLVKPEPALRRVADVGPLSAMLKASFGLASSTLDFITSPPSDSLQLHRTMKAHLIAFFDSDNGPPTNPDPVTRYMELMTRADGGIQVIGVNAYGESLPWTQTTDVPIYPEMVKPMDALLTIKGDDVVTRADSVDFWAIAGRVASGVQYSDYSTPIFVAPYTRFRLANALEWAQAYAVDRLAIHNFVKSYTPPTVVLLEPLQPDEKAGTVYVADGETMQGHGIAALARIGTTAFWNRLPLALESVARSTREYLTQGLDLEMLASSTIVAASGTLGRTVSGAGSKDTDVTAVIGQPGPYLEWLTEYVSAHLRGTHAIVLSFSQSPFRGGLQGIAALAAFDHALLPEDVKRSAVAAVLSMCRSIFKDFPGNAVLTSMTALAGASKAELLASFAAVNMPVLAALCAYETWPQAITPDDEDALPPYTEPTGGLSDAEVSTHNVPTPLGQLGITGRSIWCPVNRDGDVCPILTKIRRVITEMLSQRFLDKAAESSLELLQRLLQSNSAPFIGTMFGANLRLIGAPGARQRRAMVPFFRKEMGNLVFGGLLGKSMDYPIPRLPAEIMQISMSMSHAIESGAMIANSGATSGAILDLFPGITPLVAPFPIGYRPRVPKVLASIMSRLSMIDVFGPDLAQVKTTSAMRFMIGAFLQMGDAIASSPRLTRLVESADYLMTLSANRDPRMSRICRAITVYQSSPSTMPVSRQSGAGWVDGASFSNVGDFDVGTGGVGTVEVTIGMLTQLFSLDPTMVTTRSGLTVPRLVRTMIEYLDGLPITSFDFAALVSTGIAMPPATRTQHVDVADRRSFDILTCGRVPLRIVGNFPYSLSFVADRVPEPLRELPIEFIRDDERGLYAREKTVSVRMSDVTVGDMSQRELSEIGWGHYIWATRADGPYWYHGTADEMAVILSGPNVPVLSKRAQFAAPSPGKVA